MLSKARADLSAARLLATHVDQDDGIIGFHAQQACEKSLKAMLAVAGADIPLTH
jgi:HEPN domain-containing protein